MQLRMWLVRATLTVLGAACLTAAASAQPSTGSNADLQHFDPKGKPPSQFTIDILNHERATLPFSDTRGIPTGPIRTSP